MLNGKVYIVSAPTLVAQVQRHSKTIAFEPLVPEVTIRMTNPDPGAREVISRGFDSKDKAEQEDCLLNTMHHFIISMLGPGAVLDELSFVQLNEMAKIAGQFSDGPQLNLFDWMRRMFSMSNMLAFYGPKHIFATRPELLDTYWEYDADMVPLLTNFLPSILAPKGHAARERIKDAMVEYVEKGYHKEASPVIQGRLKINISRGLTTRQAGQVELGVMFGIMGNAMPSSFWLLTRLFTNPTLLAAVRLEISNSDLIHIEGRRHIISITKLKSHCPTLVSTFRESLRFYASNSSGRYILEDTLIADKYLLKKGYMVQVAGEAMHWDPKIWGPSVNSFDPLRFINSPYGTVASQGPDGKLKTVHTAAFRGFGGGTTLCPGRHFAQAEIVGFVAMMVAGWEVEKGDGSVLEMVGKKEPMLPLGVLRPEGDVAVRMRRRRGMEDAEWAFEV
jgi:cytochrome P450